MPYLQGPLRSMKDCLSLPGHSPNQAPTSLSSTCLEELKQPQNHKERHVGACVSQLRLLGPSTTDWGPKQQTVVSPSSAGCMSKIKAPEGRSCVW